MLKARRDYAIRSVPNILEFFGYVYCFSSILAGPAFEYKEYDNATSGKGYDKVTLDCEITPSEHRFVAAHVSVRKADQIGERGP